MAKAGPKSSLELLPGPKLAEAGPQSSSEPLPGPKLPKTGPQSSFELPLGLRLAKTGPQSSLAFSGKTFPAVSERNAFKSSVEINWNLNEFLLC